MRRKKTREKMMVIVYLLTILNNSQKFIAKEKITILRKINNSIELFAT